VETIIVNGKRGSTPLYTPINNKYKSMKILNILKIKIFYKQSELIKLKETLTKRLNYTLSKLYKSAEAKNIDEVANNIKEIDKIQQNLEKIKSRIAFNNTFYRVNRKIYKRERIVKAIDYLTKVDDILGHVVNSTKKNLQKELDKLTNKMSNINNTIFTILWLSSNERKLLYIY
jgi:tetrahydromethanopterin S-methyltransferase subunit G